MNCLALFMEIALSIKEQLGFIKKNINTVDVHHIVEIEGQLWTMEGHVKNLSEENQELKVSIVKKDSTISAQNLEIETLRKMIRDGENK